MCIRLATGNSRLADGESLRTASPHPRHSRSRFACPSTMRKAYADFSPAHIRAEGREQRSEDLGGRTTRLIGLPTGSEAQLDNMPAWPDRRAREANAHDLLVRRSSGSLDA